MPETVRTMGAAVYVQERRSTVSAGQERADRRGLVVAQIEKLVAGLTGGDGNA